MFGKKSPYTVDQIANFFISRIDSEKGDSITTLKLQKLVYYAQAWSYTLFDKKLFSNKIEAWAHGPVVRNLWERFRGIPKDTPLKIKANVNDNEFDENTFALLNDIISVYGEHSGGHLEKLTHSESPWINARGNCLPHEKCANEISLKSMKEYYSTING